MPKLGKTPENKALVTKAQSDPSRQQLLEHFAGIIAKSNLGETMSKTGFSNEAVEAAARAEAPVRLRRLEEATEGLGMTFVLASDAIGIRIPNRPQQLPPMVKEPQKERATPPRSLDMTPRQFLVLCASARLTGDADHGSLSIKRSDAFRRMQVAAQNRESKYAPHADILEKMGSNDISATWKETCVKLEAIVEKVLGLDPRQATFSQIKMKLGEGKNTQLTRETINALMEIASIPAFSNITVTQFEEDVIDWGKKKLHQS